MDETTVQRSTADIEYIADGGETIAVLIRRDFVPGETTFLTAPEQVQQVGFIVHEAGSEIPRHDHPVAEHVVRGVPECLVVRSGRTEVTLYNRGRQEVCRRTLRTGDVLVLIAGGHGFRQIEDTVLLEIKQGPYHGLRDKERF